MPAVGRTTPCFLATDSHLYIIGGHTGWNDWPPTTSVVFAPIRSDGSLGAWQETSATNEYRLNTACFVYQSKIYILGGGRHGYMTDTVAIASIQEDGSLSAWSKGGILPEKKHGMGWVIADDKVFMFGGNDRYYGGGMTDTVYKGRLTEIGVVEWALVGQLPAKLCYPWAGRNGDTIYVLGKENEPEVAVQAKISMGNNMRPGLLAHWTMDDVESGRVLDASGNGHDATVSGATSNPGVIENALQFSGNDSYLRSEVFANATTPTDFTATGWIRTKLANRGAYVFCKNDSASNGGKGWGLSVGSAQSGKLSLYVSSDGTYSPTESVGQRLVNDNRWHHVALLRTDSNWVVYVDGELDIERSGALVDSSSGLACMAWYADEQTFTGAMPGSLDDVRVYNYALTADKIASLAAQPGPGKKLVAHWTFDEGSGAVAHDSSGNSNDGNIQGAKWTAGVRGSALMFDGTDDFVKVASSDSLNLTNAGTLFAWVRIDDATYAPEHRAGILGKLVGSSRGQVSYEMDITVGGAFPNLEAYNHDGAQTNHLHHEADLRDDQWHSVAFAWSATGNILYVDGVEVARSEQTNGGGFANDFPLYIGRSRYTPTGQWESFKGKIDEARIYNYALTAEQVSALANRPEPEKRLVAHWTFDESEGRTAKDSSEYANHGNLVGGISRISGLVGTGALKMNGTDGYVQVSDSDSLDLKGMGTIAAFIRIDADFADRTGIVEKLNGPGSSPGQISYQFQYTWEMKSPYGQGLGGHINNGPTANQFPTYATDIRGAWHHVSMTWDGERVRAYIDGEEVSSTEQTIPGCLQSSYGVTLGRNWHTDGYHFLKGAIDDVRIYNYALSQQEIAQLYSLANTAELNRFAAGELGTLEAYTIRSNNSSPTVKIDRVHGNDAPSLLLDDHLNHGVYAVSKAEFEGRGNIVTFAADIMHGNAAIPDQRSAQINIVRDNQSGNYSEHRLATLAISGSTNPRPNMAHCYIRYEEGGVAKWESASFPIEDGDGWHNAKIVVRGDRHLEFYLDGEYLYTSKQQGLEEYTHSMALALGGRKSMYDNPGVTAEEVKPSVLAPPGSIKVKGGMINAVPVDENNTVVTLERGDKLSGTVTVEVTNNHRPGAVFPLGWTPTWGEHSEVYRGIASHQAPGTREYAISLDHLAIPSEPGTYYLFFVGSWEIGISKLLSATHWSEYASPIWNDGNDVATWGAEEYTEASAKGWCAAKRLFKDGNINVAWPAAGIKIIVEEGNHTPYIESMPWVNPDPVYLTESSQVGAVAMDEDMDTLTYSWTKVEGPGTVVFTPNETTDADIADVSFSAAGEYILEMTVSDGKDETSARVTVKVLNEYQVLINDGDESVTVEPQSSTQLHVTTRKFGEFFEEDYRFKVIKGKRIARVNGKGKVTFKTEGTAIIQATGKRSGIRDTIRINANERANDKPARVIRAQKFVLVDDAGRERASLGFTKDGRPILSFLAANARKPNRILIELSKHDLPKLTIQDGTGKTRFGIIVDDTDTPRLWFEDKNGRKVRELP